MNKTVAIIVLNWNGKEDTVQCVESLLKIPHTPKIFIVDNGSTDDSVRHFKTLFPQCTLIETGSNLGYAGGNNIGITQCLQQGFEYVLVLNNDTIVDPHIVEAFLKEFEENPNAGILGGKIYLMKEPKRLDHLGGYWNAKRLDFDYVGYRAADMGFDEPQLLDYACGAALMIRKKVFETIGLFEPKFFLFWEDVDFCFKARRAGFSVMSCPKAKVWHKVSASFVGGAPHSAYFFWRNRLLWIERNIKGMRKGLYLTKLISQSLLRLYSLKGLRTTQTFLQKIPQTDSTQNRERLIRYDAALTGIKDYLWRRFHEGRSKKFH